MFVLFSSVSIWKLMNVDVDKCAYDWSPNVCVFMPMLPKDMTVNDPSAFTQLCLIVSWVLFETVNFAA